MKKWFIGMVVALMVTATTVPLAMASAQEVVLDKVVISPLTAVVAPGGTQQFIAKGQNSQNQDISGVTYTWTVVAGGGAIGSTGLFTAGMDTGTFTNTVLVTAVKGTITKTAYATVRVAIPGLLDAVVLTPETATVPVSGTQQFTTAARDAFGQPVSDVAFTWEIVAGGGTINSTGLFTAGTVTGIFNNTVKVTAEKGGLTKMATATVTIAVPGLLDHVVIAPEEVTLLTSGTQQFTVAAHDAFHESVSDVTFTWAVVNGGGTIDSNGLFTAGVTPGTFTNTISVTGVKGDITKTAFVTVIIIDEEEVGFRLPFGWSQGKKTGWQGADTPPGWNKGEKTGWNGKAYPRGKIAR